MSEALNDVFVSNFEKDPTLTWQYFGSSAGFFRLYPGKHYWVLLFFVIGKTHTHTFSMEKYYMLRHKMTDS